MLDPGYANFGTRRQREIITVCCQCESIVEAADKLNLDRGHVGRVIKTVKQLAAIQGFDPGQSLNTPISDAFTVKGTSTLIDKRTGETVMQWVKTSPNQETLAKMAEHLAEAYLQDIPTPSLPRKPQDTSESYLSVYPIADPHIGLYIADRASEKPYDRDTAESQLLSGIDYLVDSSPPSKYALIANLGDFFHSDNLDNKTRRHGHTLNVDGEWDEVMRCGIRIIEYLIQKCLTKHEKVKVINAIGNHDDHTAYMLSLAMDRRYHDEPRVEIPLEYSPHFFHRHGLNLIGVHHGNTTKVKDLPGEMATTQAKDWGETKYRWWLTGHIHKTRMEEFPGVVVETFRALCPRNGYARSLGLTSLQEMQLVVLDSERGQVMRNYTTF